MNNQIRKIFIIVLIMFALLGVGVTNTQFISASSLNADARNQRTILHAAETDRGPIIVDKTAIVSSEREQDSKRYARSYAEGPLYAPVTGYFSSVGNASTGIEAAEEDVLDGQSQTLLGQRLRNLLTGQNRQGGGVELTLNSQMQKAAAEALGNRKGAVVALDAKTGAVLAMYSSPTYDPNQLASHDMSQANSNYGVLSQDATNPMLNRATSQLYPPGSTFKTVVAAAALETGQYQPDTQIPAGASYTLPGTVTQLTNAVPQADGADGKISMEDALAYSSNTAFAQLGVSLGDNAVSSMAKKLGFDSPITVDGSDYTGTPWVSVTSKFPTDINDDKLALASIGQGDTVVTPLQNAMVAAAIANDGKLMQPTLVDRVRSADLSVISQTKPTVMSHAFSADTANKLTQMMEAVVTKENTNLAINGVQVAIKTGTAQIGNGNTSIDGWVIGFAPADDPKIAVAVVVHNVDLYGSFAAGPVMKAMMQEALAE